MRPSKGFTIIELLIAMLILMFVMISFLGGLLNYMRFSLDSRMKNTMDKAVKDWAGYLESYPYNLLNVSSAFGSGWCDPTTNQCSFENIDSDGDGIPDFYDPYNGNNNNFWNNPTATASWLLTLPPLASSPPLVYTVAGRRYVYTGITMATVTLAGKETGKAFGITAWYFSPVNRRYKYESTLLIKRKP
jgi:type II secretory pathway pseudopilin PulG